MNQLMITTKTNGSKVKQLMELEVRGKNKIWCFPTICYNKYLKEWQNEGVNIGPLPNTIRQRIMNMNPFRSEKQLMILQIRGKNKLYNFTVRGNNELLEEQRDDGLDINPLVNIVPEWIVNIGLLHPWCFFQDLLNNAGAGRILIGLIIVGIVLIIL